MRLSNIRLLNNSEPERLLPFIVVDVLSFVSRCSHFGVRSWSRSKYTTTGERYNSARGPLREQLLAGTMEKWEDQNAPITADLIARLKKTTAVSSRNVVIYIPKWLHRETNDNTLNYSFWKSFSVFFLRHLAWTTLVNMELLSVDRFTIEMNTSVFAKQVLPESTAELVSSI